ncbi:MAG: DoxX family protein [Leptolyngbyaceae cyanobacterium SL_7_1]|nr:DoxX family protein [Leptolyngbyaceae cyanobacterium SL_7_1]
MDLQTVLPLIARSFLAVIFVHSGINKLLNFAGTQETIASKGIPLPLIALILTIAVEVIGGLLVILGYKAWLGALLLFLFLIPATLVFHNPLVDPTQLTQFLKNLSIMGGLLMVVAYGSGALSLERSTTRWEKDL